MAYTSVRASLLSALGERNILDVLYGAAPRDFAFPSRLRNARKHDYQNPQLATRGKPASEAAGTGTGGAKRLFGAVGSGSRTIAPESGGTGAGASAGASAGANGAPAVGSPSPSPSPSAVSGGSGGAVFGAPAPRFTAAGLAKEKEKEKEAKENGTAPAPASSSAQEAAEAAPASASAAGTTTISARGATQEEEGIVDSEPEEEQEQETTTKTTTETGTEANAIPPPVKAAVLDGVSTSTSSESAARAPEQEEEALSKVAREQPAEPSATPSPPQIVEPSAHAEADAEAEADGADEKEEKEKLPDAASAAEASTAPEAVAAAPLAAGTEDAGGGGGSASNSLPQTPGIATEDRQLLHAISDASHRPGSLDAIAALASESARERSREVSPVAPARAVDADAGETGGGAQGTGAGADTGSSAVEGLLGRHALEGSEGSAAALSRGQSQLGTSEAPSPASAPVPAAAAVAASAGAESAAAGKAKEAEPAAKSSSSSASVGVGQGAARDVLTDAEREKREIEQAQKADIAAGAVSRGSIVLGAGCSMDEDGEFGLSRQACQCACHSCDAAHTLPLCPCPLLHRFAPHAVEPAIRALGSNRSGTSEFNTVLLSVDLQTQVLQLHEAPRFTPAAELCSVLSGSEPRLLFYRYDYHNTNNGTNGGGSGGSGSGAGGGASTVLYVYCCPGKSSIRSKMIYSVCVMPLFAAVKRMEGMSIVKKVSGVR